MLDSKGSGGGASAPATAPADAPKPADKPADAPAQPTTPLDAGPVPTPGDESDDEEISIEDIPF